MVSLCFHSPASFVSLPAFLGLEFDELGFEVGGFFGFLGGLLDFPGSMSGSFSLVSIFA
jgi:hypothetical protein